MYNPDKPYNELPLLPPEVVLTPKIFNKAIGANKALAELKGMAAQIPNPMIILNGLVLREAKDSSEIENIVTTQDELYRAVSSDQQAPDPAVKEVLNYKEALWLGYELIEKKKLITVRELIKIQECLIGNDAGIRKQPGTALKNARTGQVIYTPPFGKAVIEDKLKNLEDYINDPGDNDVDPLIRMAVIHYQFESIHPFYDGNGRTGRILNVLYLIRQKLLQFPILYMSTYINQNKQLYYHGLDKVRKGDWEDWIIYMLESVEFSATDSIKTIKKIRDLLEKTIEKMRLKLPKIYSRELAEAIFHQPYIRISALEKWLGISRFTASKYLKELESLGVLKGSKSGRDMLYLNVGLFKALKG
jgi:Fic family protein